MYATPILFATNLTRIQINNIYGRSVSVLNVISEIHISVLERLSEILVLVSDTEKPSPSDTTICAENKHGQGVDICLGCNYGTRDPPKVRGRYVTIQRKANASKSHLLNFCEVEVLSCHPGWWGIELPKGTEDCSQACSNCNEVETCGVSDGYCYTGCKDGWYGRGCSKQCNCTQATCDRSDGTCTGE